MSTQTITRSVRTTLAEHLDGWRYERNETGAEWDHTTHDGAYHRVRLWSWTDMIEVLSPHLDDVEVRIMVSTKTPGVHRVGTESPSLPPMWIARPERLIELLDELGVPEAELWPL